MGTFSRPKSSKPDPWFAFVVDEEAGGLIARPDFNVGLSFRSTSLLYRDKEGNPFYLFVRAVNGKAAMAMARRKLKAYRLTRSIPEVTGSVRKAV